MMQSLPFYCLDYHNQLVNILLLHPWIIIIMNYLLSAGPTISATLLCHIQLPFSKKQFISFSFTVTLLINVSSFKMTRNKWEITRLLKYKFYKKTTGEYSVEDSLFFWKKQYWPKTEQKAKQLEASLKFLIDSTTCIYITGITCHVRRHKSRILLKHHWHDKIKTIWLGINHEQTSHIPSNQKTVYVFSHNHYSLIIFIQQSSKVPIQ